MLRILSQYKEEQSDMELLQLFKSSGQLTYLSKLYGRYIELTYGLCLKYLQHEKMAEDAVMDIFESLVKKVPQHDIHNFKSWLHTFSRNHCFMQLRKGKKEITINYAPNLMYSMEKMHPLDTDNEETKERDKQEAYLRDCLEQLKLEQKSCVTLFYYKNKTYKDIADMKNIAVGKVRSFIQNGRRNLKNCLEENEG